MRIWVSITVLLLLLFYLFTLVMAAQGRELYPGQYALVPQHIQDWFKSQKNPKGEPCCSVADGTYAEEDVRGDYYWTRFQTAFGITEWMPVPDSALIRGPNPNGSAVVWYYFQDGKPVIRCFIPGGGV